MGTCVPAEPALSRYGSDEPMGTPHPVFYFKSARRIGQTEASTRTCLANGRQRSALILKDPEADRPFFLDIR